MESQRVLLLNYPYDRNVLVRWVRKGVARGGGEKQEGDHRAGWNCFYRSCVAAAGPAAKTF